MDWMPVSEAASVLGVSERTIYNRVKTHKIEARQVAGRTEVLAIAGRRVDAWGRPLVPRAPTCGTRDPQRDGLEAVNRLADSLESQVALFGELHRGVVRSRRWAWGACLVGLFGMAISGYWYRDHLARYERSYRDAWLALQQRCAGEMDSVAACRATVPAEQQLAGGP